ncbi:uncharacterized protein LOC126890985 [Diabrotica virgifera virgifera]|uniref:Uncharacterized protein n=1 Tax=Diabrotica virgifera virgifera TaxID=50390 RepID=A0ABM5L105_DIAVI|nr:uncharacterized protein LOC126890985 [Diabrotica virgifera virgifera]
MNNNNSNGIIDTDNSPNTKKYFTALTHSPITFPSKEQGIIFSAIEGLKLQDYLLELGPIVDPKNIIFSSKISNNRVCVYLSSKSVVDKFLKEHNSIKINNRVIPVRKLVIPSQRLVLSNVSPTIPHNLLETKLKTIGLQLMSPITFLRIGAPDPAYSHILSFRRQVYISPPEDNFQIPEVLEIYHDDLTYHIYLTTDTLCYTCKQPGHLASRYASLQLQAPTSPYTKSQQQRSSLDNPSDSNNSSEAISLYQILLTLK